MAKRMMVWDNEKKYVVIQGTEKLLASFLSLNILKLDIFGLESRLNQDIFSLEIRKLNSGLLECFLCICWTDIQNKTSVNLFINVYFSLHNFTKFMLWFINVQSSMQRSASGSRGVKTSDFLSDWMVLLVSVGRWVRVFFGKQLTSAVIQLLLKTFQVIVSRGVCVMFIALWRGQEIKRWLNVSLRRRFGSLTSEKKVSWWF